MPLKMRQDLSVAEMETTAERFQSEAIKFDGKICFSSW